MYYHTMTPAKQDRFLEVLADTGNVMETCDILGVSRSTVYNRRAKDPEFAARWDQAVEMQVNQLRQVVVKTVLDLMPKVVRVPLKDRDGNKVLDDNFEEIMVPMPAGGDMDLLRSVASRGVFPENRSTNVQVNASTTVRNELPNRKPKLVRGTTGSIQRLLDDPDASGAHQGVEDAELIQGTTHEPEGGDDA